MDCGIIRGAGTTVILGDLVIRSPALTKISPALAKPPPDERAHGLVNPSAG
jgi:hypothetical protein